MNIKIHGWKTRQNIEPLCRSCLHAHIHCGPANSQEAVVCQAIFQSPMQIRYPVIECNEYHNKNLAPITEMNKIAWFINADPKTGKVGFLSGDKVPDKMKDDVHENNPF